MDAIPFAAARAFADANLESCDRLTVELSLRFTRLHVDELESAIAGSLEQIGMTLGVDAARLGRLHQRPAETGR